MNAVLQDPASRDDLPAIQFGSSEDEDEFNGRLQKRNLFQSFQHNPFHLSPNVSSLSINSDTSTSSQAPSDSSKFNTKTRKRRPFSSNNSSVPSTHPNHSESSQQNPFMTEILLPNLKRDEISALLRRKNAIKSKGIHHDTRNGFGKPVTSSKSPVDFPSVTSSSKTTNGDDVSSTLQGNEIPEILSSSSSDSVQIPYPVDHFSSISASHHSCGVPNILPSVTQTFISHDDSAICSDYDQQYSSESNNHPGSTPIPQPPPLTSTSPNVETPPLNSTTTDSNPISPKDNSSVRKIEARRKPNTISFLFNLVTPHEKVQPLQTQQWRPPLRSLQRINDSGYSLPSDDFTPAPDGILAWKMEELERLRRMESRNLVAQTRTGFETSSSKSTAIPRVDQPPQPQTLQECVSSDVATSLKQQALQTQLDKALAELRGVEVENKRLTSENQSQQSSISQLKITVDEQNKSLIQINNQLHVAISSLTLLNKEKTEWQDKLDSMQHKLNAAERQVRCLDHLNKEKTEWQDKLDLMQHKLNAAERQVRCLDHLTRQKVELRQGAGYGQPRRRGLFASIPASTDVIGGMRTLNEEIYQTCVQFAEGLERTAVFSTERKPQVQKVLGDHLTAMVEDHAKKATSGYNLLLMQTVMEVFMTHWCSSIIEAFYPKLESFSDLLVQLSAQTSSK